MSDWSRNYLSVFSLPRVSIRKLLLLSLAVLAVIATFEFFALGLARRTFIFYAGDSGIATVEERLLRVPRGKRLFSPLREVDITRYVEETLLGPVSPNALPLFPKETRLNSLLYRNGVVYADFSAEAALPPTEGALISGALSPNREVFTNMETLHSGIKRNFPFVREIHFFITGKPAYAGKFR
jgi:hypothetical protein